MQKQLHPVMELVPKPYETNNTENYQRANATASFLTWPAAATCSVHTGRRSLWAFRGKELRSSKNKRNNQAITNEIKAEETSQQNKMLYNCTFSNQGKTLAGKRPMLTSIAETRSHDETESHVTQETRQV